MRWQKIRLSVEDVVSGKHMKLCETFKDLFMDLGAPKDMAIFDRGLPDGGVEIYFSPCSYKPLQILLKALSGVECDKPVRDDKLALSIGHANSWELLAE